MPSVFTDEANDYDLSITTAADWTVSTGGLPNGDNYVTADGTVGKTFNLEGDDFDVLDGTAWSFECWWYYVSAGSATQFILSNWVDNVGNPFPQWGLFFSSSEELVFRIYNDVGGAYMSVATATSITASTWHHFVAVKQTGTNLKAYHNGSVVATVTSTTGTLFHPTADYRIWLGSAPDGTSPINSPTYGSRLGKVAIYNSELSAARISTHYLAMTT